MTCRLLGAKPLPVPMLPYSQLDSKEHHSVKFCLKFKGFHPRKWTWKCYLRNGSHFCLGLNVLIGQHERNITHCYLVMPYGIIDLNQQWLRRWLVAWWHQAITSNQCCLICHQLEPEEHISMKSQTISVIFIEEMASENAVCKVAAILFSHQCVKQLSYISCANLQVFEVICLLHRCHGWI